MNFSDEQMRALGLEPARWSIAWNAGKSPTGNPTGQRHLVVRVKHLPSGREKTLVADRLNKADLYEVRNRLVAQLLHALDPSWRARGQGPDRPAVIPKRKGR